MRTGAVQMKSVSVFLNLGLSGIFLMIPAAVLAGNSPVPPGVATCVAEEVAGATSRHAEQLQRAIVPLKHSVQTFDEALKAVPALRQCINEIMEDAAVPRKFKLILKDALEKGNVSIREITEKIRPMMHPRARASFLTESHVFQTAGKSGQKADYIVLSDIRLESSTVAVSQDLNRMPKVRIGKPGQGFALEVPDVGGSDLTALIHELAHVRFERFIQRNIQKLSKKFPKDMIIPVTNQVPGLKGKYAVNKQLYDYLSERYAHAIEADAHRALKGKYFYSPNLKYDLNGLRPNETMGELRIIEDAEITDPRIVSMEGRSLFNILREGYDPVKHGEIPLKDHLEVAARRIKDETDKNIDFLRMFED